jgi:putative oxidoreductase
MTITTSTSSATSQALTTGLIGRIAKLIGEVIKRLNHLPLWPVQLLGRFSIAAVFWKSGQTKVEGFVVDLVSGEFVFKNPRLSDSVVSLFRDEYKLPIIPPEIAATLAAFSEHLFPTLILLGFATRFSALALLGMTAVIQLLVYPGAYPTHGMWAAVLLLLVLRGAGPLSIDQWLKKFS